LYIVLYFSIEKTRERVIILTFSPYLSNVNEYLTKKMSNFESIYEVELTSYYSMMVMMIGRRRRRRRRRITKIPIKFILDGMQ
jgi:hypothetical protein